MCSLCEQISKAWIFPSFLALLCCCIGALAIINISLETIVKYDEQCVSLDAVSLL